MRIVVAVPSPSRINVCFHGVGTPGRALEPGEDRYWVTVDQFEEIVTELATWPAVGVSFDDGNASDVEVALDALKRAGLSATFFVLAGRVGAPGSVDEPGVRALRDAGMRIGLHGMHHRPWPGLDDARLDAELGDARRLLAEIAGPIDHAACPLGRYDRRTLAQLKARDFARVYTSDRRRARPGAWLQPRFSVRREDTAGTLRDGLLLAGAPAPRRVRDALTATVKRLR